MKFIFLRHAQATHNSDAVIRGDVAYTDPINTDAALDPYGIKQAIANEQTFLCAAMYCSPLQRCYQTLLAMMPASSELPVRLNDLLMEPQGMALCNKRSAKATIAAAVPALWDLTHVSDQNPFDMLTEGYTSAVQTTPEFSLRVRRFMEYLQAQHSDDETILIVSHHDWIRTWFYIYKGTVVSPKNAQVLYSEFSGEKT
jgi:broad specificity phosphatase PhoE